MMVNDMKNKKGFTLVELLAVLLILSIIMGLALPAIFTMNKKIKNRGYDSKIELMERAAVNYAQNHANAIKGQIDPKIGGSCNNVTSLYTVNSSRAKCAKDPIKGTGSEQRVDDYKYVFYVNLKTLIESGDYKIEGDVTNECSVRNPVDESKCLDCMYIEVWLDDLHKNATAYFGKSPDMSDTDYKSKDKKTIDAPTSCNIITPLS